MHSDQAPCRELWERLLTGGASTVGACVTQWLAGSGAGEAAWLADFATRKGDPVPAASVEDLWRLYGLSRVNQLLLLAFQVGERDGSAFRPEFTADGYVRFGRALGFVVVEPSDFHPFACETVEVLEAVDPTTEPELIGIAWPALTLGPMMFSRAGCRLRAGANHMVKSIAEQSTLYWACRRKNRPYRDRSQGWGGNSQWRTTFRRDYAFDDHHYFNVDGDASWVDESDDLPVAARAELLVNRCFVRTDAEHDELFPYDYQLVTTR